MITAGPVHRARLAAVAALSAAGVASPQHDAAELLAHVLDTRPGLLPLADPLDAAQADRYAALVARRAAREPLQHILGTAGFYGLDVLVGPGVFVPRPETELLVELGLQAVAARPVPVVVDLCAGSGAVAVAIAAARPEAHVAAVERSPAALDWLRRNVARLAPRVRIVAADALAALPVDPATGRVVEGAVDLVTCNPPYVPTTTLVDAEVGAHDPPVAVFAGADGLELIRPLVGRIGALLRPGGVVLLEHDDSHQDAVLRLFTASGLYADAEGLRDLAGRPRLVRAVRR